MVLQRAGERTSGGTRPDSLPSPVPGLDSPGCPKLRRLAPQHLQGPVKHVTQVGPPPFSGDAIEANPPAVLAKRPAKLSTPCQPRVTKPLSRRMLRPPQ